MSKETVMAFKNNLREPFIQLTLRGRGTKAKGLNHGGQYSVDYIVDGLNKPKEEGKSAHSGQPPYLRNSPPVASPRPTSAEEKDEKCSWRR